MRLVDYEGLEAHPTANISPEAHYYGNGKVVVGEQSRIDHGCILTGDVVIGKRVHLAVYCILQGKHGIHIGDYSGFGAFTTMHTESDDYTGQGMFGPCVPDEYRAKKSFGKITIGRAVIGGTRVTILPGVFIDDGASIGAHSLVKSDCYSDCIHAGVPAKLIKTKAPSNMWGLIRDFEASLG